MRIPRWLLMTLIAVTCAALFVVPMWLWDEMPRRTAADFMAAIESRQLDRVNELLTNATCGLHTYESNPPYVGITFDNRITQNLSNSDLVLVRRSLRDLLVGEQRLVVQKHGREVGVMFVATWENVTSDSEELAGRIDAILQAERTRIQKMRSASQRLRTDQ